MDDRERAVIFKFFFSVLQSVSRLPAMISRGYWELKRQADSRPRDPVPLYKTDPICGLSSVRTSAHKFHGLRMMRAHVVA
jgi:hypothetical protein